MVVDNHLATYSTHQSRILFSKAEKNPVSAKLSSFEVQMAKPNIIGTNDKLTYSPEYSPIKVNANKMDINSGREGGRKEWRGNGHERKEVGVRGKKWM